MVIGHVVDDAENSATIHSSAPEQHGGKIAALSIQDRQALAARRPIHATHQQTSGEEDENVPFHAVERLARLGLIKQPGGGGG